MNNLVSQADFIDQIAIPQDYWNANAATLTNLIAKGQQELLRKLLGNTLYEAFETGLAAGSPEQRWTDLRDGVSYTVGSLRWQFVGVKSMVKDYVYYEYQRNAASFTTPAGEGKANMENATRILNSDKMARAYNEMCTWANDLWYMLFNKREEDGTATYHEAVRGEIKWSIAEPINQFNI